MCQQTQKCRLCVVCWMPQRNEEHLAHNAVKLVILFVKQPVNPVPPVYNRNGPVQLPVWPRKGWWLGQPTDKKQETIKVAKRARWRAQEESLILSGSDQAVENRVRAFKGLVVVIWCYPCSPCSYFSRTYCDLWYRWVYYNEMDNAEWKPNMQNIQEGAHTKKRRVLLASLSQ